MKSNNSTVKAPLIVLPLNTGAPFVFHNAETLLHILEESGTVRICPFTFHDYLKGGDDEGVMGLPYEEDCDKEDELTRAQYDEIVRLAEWEPDVQLKLDETVRHLFVCFPRGRL